ncbi:hypothetical protein ACIP96_04835 [Streptomyces nigra]|uniref:hypothetical protein n=1 Tax=Streptomyces nigra TaxID=1827580 RepID=UPI0037F4311F
MASRRSRHEKNRIQVDAGEEFALSVPVDTAMGEWWYLTSPEPDPDVVRGPGKREEIEADEDVVGSCSGTDLFDFEAVGPGTTEIRLIQCPGAPAPAAEQRAVRSPPPRPERQPTPDEKYRATVHAYTVTVRKP